MASIQNQIKARIQQIGSPKIKLTNNQGPTIIPSQSQMLGQGLKTQLQKPFTRDGNNQSQSPDDQGVSRGVLQRIQMKNLAFIPAKGQSPVGSNNTTQNSSIIINQNENSPQDANNTSQIQKISPQRIIGIGNKVVIPANQIKLIKKDGTSPSPEGRQNFTIKQLSPTSVNFVMQQSSLQNKNLIIQQHNTNQEQTPLNINNQNKSSKNLLAIITQQEQQNAQHEGKHTTAPPNFSNNQMSDDETNVNSDNEDERPTHSHRNSAALNQMKADQSNFNRPKINPNLQSSQINSATFTDQTLASQRTQRGSVQSNLQILKSNLNSNGLQDQNSIKVISQNKIRQSPSPPPNQVLKNLNSNPSMTNVQIQNKHPSNLNQNFNNQTHQSMSHSHSTTSTHVSQHNHHTNQLNQHSHHGHQNQQSHHQLQNQSSQQQLASDFIKGMINQSKNGNSQNNQIGQKKVLGPGLQSVLKKGLLSGGGSIAQQNPQQPSQNPVLYQQNQNITQSQISVNFNKDMKKHGIAKDINDVNTFAQVLQENSPPRIEDSKQTISNIGQKVIPQKITVTKISHIRNYSPPPNFDQSALTPLNDIKDVSKITTKPTESSPTNVSTQHEEQNQTNNGTNEQGVSVFQFPFQRRARSLSLPKQEMIQNKMQQKNQGVQPPSGNPPQDGADKTSQSPNRNQEQDKAVRNKPVVAKINFVIQKGGVIQKEDEEAVFERNKEVDEWLMGSGESDATAASNTSNNLKAGFPNGIQTQINSTNIIVSQGKHTHGKKSVTNFEKPVQPDKQNDGDDDSVGQEEEEDWMFKTFDKVKANKNNSSAVSNNKASTQNNNNNIMQSRRLESNRDFNIEVAFEDPFEMAPEMSKQLNNINNHDFDPFMSDLQMPSTKLNNKVSGDKNNDNKQLASFIDQIDEYIEQGFI